MKTPKGQIQCFLLIEHRERTESKDKVAEFAVPVAELTYSTCKVLVCLKNQKFLLQTSTLQIQVPSDKQL